MAQKKAYSRYFIILQQDVNGYSLASDKLPSGYAKLETKNDKCKVSYYVQNLKKEMEPYFMTLICNKKDVKKLIKLGTMNIDDFGRAEITFEYGVDDVGGSSIPVDMINGAAIIKYVNSSIISVMSGFSTTDIPANWKNFEMFEVGKVEEKRVEEVPEAAVQPEDKVNEVVEQKVEEVKEEVQAEERQATEETTQEEKNIFEEYEKKIEEIKEVSDNREEDVEVNSIPEENTTENPPEGNDEEIVEERVEVRSEESEQVNLQEDIEEALPVNSKKGKEKDKCDHEHKDEDKDKCDHEHKDEDKDKCDHKHKDEDKEKYDHKHKEKHEEDFPSGTVGDFFKALAEDFEEMKDSCKEIKRCKWHKVKVDSMDDMCNTTNYNKYTIVYYPMISYYPYIKKHGHYLFGYKYDANGRMKYIVYGIPGTKSKMDQPYGGKSGFVTWVPLKEGDEKEDSFGYWMMFYDFRTSTIVIPVK